MSSRVASLFSGCGGSSLGYKLAGCKVEFANEFVPAAADSYRANFPTTLLNTSDIRELTPDDLPADLDILDGSPPCQAFSSARAGHGTRYGQITKYSDTAQRTDDLFFEYARLLEGARPRAFVAENVVGLTRGKAKGYFLRIMERLRSCGYRVDARILDASYYGVPQARLRLIFIGFRDDLGLDPVYPESGKRIGVRDVFPYVAKVKHGGGFLRYRSAALPCPTVTVMGYTIPEVFSFSAGNFIETIDGTRRRWTIDELKLVCGFPPDFVLTGTEEQQWERLARAVPPPLMRAIATTVAGALEARVAA